MTAVTVSTVNMIGFLIIFLGSSFRKDSTKLVFRSCLSNSAVSICFFILLFRN